MQIGPHSWEIVVAGTVIRRDTDQHGVSVVVQHARSACRRGVAPAGAGVCPVRVRVLFPICWQRITGQEVSDTLLVLTGLTASNPQGRPIGPAHDDRAPALWGDLADY